MWGERQAEATWTELRATRADPPPAALLSAARRQTYVFALEQAEQMFRAATTVGPATRPLLIFYGLSQAGRAIAAAAQSAGSEWALVGHGIRTIDLAAPLADTRVFADGSAKGSFMRLSQILHSPTWDKAVAIPLSALWDSLPENRLWPLADGPQRRTALLVADHYQVEPHPLASAAVAYLPPWLISSPQPRKDLDDFMTAYPAASGYGLVTTGTGPDAAPAFTPHTNGWGEVVMHWSAAEGRAVTIVEQNAYLAGITQTYGHQRYLFPTIGANTDPLHPLMTWWAILFTLSMLARYQPAEWASHINVDASTAAVPIECLLSVAITAVPSLVAETIQQVQ